MLLARICAPRPLWCLASNGKAPFIGGRRTLPHPGNYRSFVSVLARYCRVRKALTPATWLFEWSLWCTFPRSTSSPVVVSPSRFSSSYRPVRVRSLFSHSFSIVRLLDVRVLVRKMTILMRMRMGSFFVAVCARANI